MQGIYAIENVVTGQHYIGSASIIQKRWTAHRSALKHGRHHCHRLQRAWDKYGQSAFDFKVFEPVIGVKAVLHTREQEWLDTNSGRLYNESTTARGGCDAIAAAKVSAANTGRKRTPEQCACMSAAKRHQSAETRAKISAAKKGKQVCWAKGLTLGPRTAEQRQRISEGHKGIRHSDTTRQKMRDSYDRSPETIARRVAGRANRHSKGTV